MTFDHPYNADSARLPAGPFAWLATCIRSGSAAEVGQRLEFLVDLYGMEGRSAATLSCPPFSTGGRSGRSRVS